MPGLPFRMVILRYRAFTPGLSVWGGLNAKVGVTTATEPTAAVCGIFQSVSVTGCRHVEVDISLFDFDNRTQVEGEESCRIASSRQPARSVAGIEGIGRIVVFNPVHQGVFDGLHFEIWCRGRNCCLFAQG